MNISPACVYSFVHGYFFVDPACSINSDIFFVLDSSGSIGAANFEVMKMFTRDFVNSLKIGPSDNQVGVILFDNTAAVQFYLNSYSTKENILTAIESLFYQSGDTNTADGLCKLINNGYTTKNGARLSSAGVFRVAVVMTDGRSNRVSYDCSSNNTFELAKAVHRFEPSILVYVVGVTNNVDYQELAAIATKPDYVSNIISFDQLRLREIQEKQKYDLCNKGRPNNST